MLKFHVRSKHYPNAVSAHMGMAAMLAANRAVYSRDRSQMVIEREKSNRIDLVTFLPSGEMWKG